MSRKAREKSSTGVYAVTVRGNDTIFSSKKMKEVFLTAAEKYLGDGLLGIRFSPDKAEMLVKESPSGISKDMKPLTTSFARSCNRANKTGGKVFADRFKSVPVETDELRRECIAYLEGGKPAMPFKRGNRQTSAKPAKPEIKKPEPVREEPAPTPRRQHTMPSWLL